MSQYSHDTRAMYRLECLRLAVGFVPQNKIIETAKQMYEFVIKYDDSSDRASS